MKRSSELLQTKGGGDRHVLLIGANGRTENLVRALPPRGASSWCIEGFLDDDPARSDVLERHGVRYLGRIAELERVLTERVVDCVYVCLPLRSSYDAVQGVVDLCGRGGVPVRMATDLLESHRAPGTLWRMEDMAMMSLEAQPQEEAFAEGRQWTAYVRLTAMLVPFAILAATSLGLGTEMRASGPGGGAVHARGSLPR